MVSNKTEILLAYNCEYVFSALIFLLVFCSYDYSLTRFCDCDNHFVFVVDDSKRNRIKVWDSKKKPLSLLDPLVEVLNA